MLETLMIETRYFSVWVANLKSKTQRLSSEV